MTLPPLRATVHEVQDKDDVSDLESLVASSIAQNFAFAYVVHGELSSRLMENLRRTHRSERCKLNLEGLSTIYTDDYYQLNVKGKKVAFADISSEAAIVDEAIDQVKKFLRWDLVVVLRVSSRQASTVAKRLLNVAT